MLETPSMLRYSLYNEDQIREPDLTESYGSDNSSAADNQQERLIKIGWISGFVDRNRRHDNHKEDLYRFSVARRNDLIKVIIPFFEKYPLRTSKQFDFMKFAECVRLMQFDVHLTLRGLIRIAEIAETMNHCKSRAQMIRILRDYMPNADKVGEDIVPSAWRHAGARCKASSS